MIYNSCRIIQSLRTSPSQHSPIAKLTVMTLQEVDRLLDELENASRSLQSNESFWHLALETAIVLSNGRSASLLLPMQGTWSRVIAVGEGNGITNAIGESLSQASAAEHPHGLLRKGWWGAVRLNPESIEEGFLFLEFPPGEPDWKRRAPLIAGIGEICWTRTLHRRQKLTEGKVTGLQRGISALTKTNVDLQCNSRLVDNLAAAFEADRASYLTLAPSPKLRACSGAHSIDATSSVVHAIEEIANASLKADSNQIAVHTSPDKPLNAAIVATDDAPSLNPSKVVLFPNRVAIPWKKPQQPNTTEMLLMEWSSKETMLEHLSELPRYIAAIYPVWEQQHRWLRLPAWLRNMASNRWLKNLSAGGWKTTKLASIVVLLLLGWWLAWRPYPMTIHADATLEPISMRSIYVSMDGFIDTLRVRDGERVVEGQMLAQLRSPTLELQIEEAVGKLRAMAEKRNGLRVAINQLDPSRPDSVASQGRISSELLVLDTQETHAKEMLQFLRSEQKKLQIDSPIDGVVVATDLQRELENRPLRRGDLMFNVVELDGGWRMRIEVADRDTQYVRRYAIPDKTDVELVFDSLPAESFRGTVTQLANGSESLRGLGSYQMVFASVDKETASRLHMGAKGTAFFHCGEEAAWYVWSRPIVEFFQKRSILFRWTQKEEG